MINCPKRIGSRKRWLHDKGVRIPSIWASYAADNGLGRSQRFQIRPQPRLTMAVPVITTARMRQWERATWAAGRSEQEVISRVGHFVAHRAKALTRPGDAVVILAGKGHNGDDARQAVQHLSDRELTLVDVQDPGQAERELGSLWALDIALIIDGMFGIGLNRPLSAAWVKFIDRLNLSGVPVLAIDVPSGLDADRGVTFGAAVRATITLTLGAPKVGLLKAEAAEYVGRLEVAPDIGLTTPPKSGAVWWTLAEDFLRYPPAREASAHKGSFGHVVLVAGSVGFHGAGVLAARGAMRARPGLVSLWTDPECYVAASAHLQTVMVHPWEQAALLPSSCTAVGFGPGLASPSLDSALRGKLAEWWSELPIPVLADASALDWLPRGRGLARRGLRVITPHPGEAARLLGTGIGEVQRERLEALRALSKRYGGCWVVLKGQHTLIGCDKGPCYVNGTGNPGLAQGGSGDILAGFLAGLLAQTQLCGDPAKVLRFGVWAHGAAADRLNLESSNWTVDEIIPWLGRV